MDELTNELTEEERQAILDERRAWRAMFNSPAGRIAFRRMAKECYFFNDNLSPNDYDGIAKNNYFKTILERLGDATRPDATADAIADAILDALLKLPLASKVKK